MRFRSNHRDYVAAAVAFTLVAAACGSGGAGNEATTTATSTTVATTAPPVAVLPEAQLTVEESMVTVNGTEVPRADPTRIEIDDQIALGDGALAFLRLGDPIKFELIKGTKLQLESVESLSIEAFLKAGHLRFTADDETDAQLKLTTPNAVLNTLRSGTQFTFCQAPTGGVCVSVSKGVVEVSKAGRTETFVAGESSFAGPDDPLGPPICVPDEAFDEWFEASRRNQEPRPLSKLVADSPLCDASTTDATGTPTTTIVPAPPSVTGVEIQGEPMRADGSIDGFVFGSIDGVAFDSVRGQLLAVKEPASPAVREQIPAAADPAVFRIPIGNGAEFSIDLRNAVALPLLRQDGSAYGLELDVEGMEQAGDGGFFVVSGGSSELDNEGGPFVHRFDASGRYQSELQLPSWYEPNAAGTSGITPLRGLHGISQRPGSPGEVIVVVEAPLAQDHDPSQPSEQKIARLLAFDIETGSATAEWGYPLDVVPPEFVSASSAPTSTIIDIAALSDGALVVLERSRAEGTAVNVLYRVELGAGTSPDPALPPSVKKSRLAVVGGDESVFQSSRSISEGPVLSDGRKTLLLVSDNAFGDEPTQILVVAENVSG